MCFQNGQEFRERFRVNSRDRDRPVPLTTVLNDLRIDRIFLVEDDQPWDMVEL